MIWKHGNIIYQDKMKPEVIKAYVKTVVISNEQLFSFGCSSLLPSFLAAHCPGCFRYLAVFALNLENAYLVLQVMYTVPLRTSETGFISGKATGP